VTPKERGRGAIPRSARPRSGWRRARFGPRWIGRRCHFSVTAKNGSARRLAHPLITARPSAAELLPRRAALPTLLGNFAPRAAHRSRTGARMAAA
jgi:hypothetical protein